MQIRNAPVGDDVPNAMKEKHSRVKVTEGYVPAFCLFSVSRYTERALLFERGKPIENRYGKNGIWIFESDCKYRQCLQ